MSEWIEAEEHAERGRHLAEAGEWDGALRELREALRVIPNQADWLMTMAQALDALERYGEAAAAYEKVVRVRGENLDTLVAMGVDLVRAGDPARALGAFRRATEIDPDHEPAYCHRIAAHTQLGQHDEAEAAFYLARQVTDECPLCYDYLAQSLAMRGDLRRAAWCWEQTLRLEPGLPGVAGSLARAYWQLGDAERAQRCLQLELRDNPEDVDSLLTLGTLLMEMDRPREADHHFRHALLLDATLYDAHLCLGDLALRNGELDAAEAQFERARQIEPDRPGARAGTAQVELTRGARDRAQTLLQAELSIEGRTPVQSVTLARLLIEADLPREAVALLDPLIEEATDSAMLPQPLLSEALLCRGAGHIMVGRTREGIIDTKQAVSLSPDNPIGLHNLALAYLETGRLGRAAYWLNRAIAVGGDDGSLHHTRRRLLARLVWARTRRALRTLLPPWRFPGSGR